ncbi:hypothetical protein Agub_g8563 [Astrephomene gubernaculifera]|uniref:Uncharacterized protein n=1 Tax=Astrephomene gubernaculifera TaxID=47775 RepID=A0AAD3DRW7_9CHLO|nr:hypothetical protein Agub_g8563 [Astrephomene gubernaculifera]
MEASATTCPSQRHRSVADVLHELSVPALDTLYEKLQAARCLTAARLTCRALREAIDGSVRKLRLTVKKSVRKKWEAGHLPSLLRWPRCTSINLVYAVRGQSVEASEDAASLLALPFSGLPLEARKRIKHLELEEDDDKPLPAVETVVSVLVHRLPALRELEIFELSGMSYGRPNLQLMYDSMASLSYLERLKLPSVAALQCVSVLAASGSSDSSVCRLRRLEIHPSIALDESVVNPESLGELARLTTLRELRLYDCDLLSDSRFEPEEEAQGDAFARRTSHHARRRPALLPLLSCLPPSLERLELDRCRYPNARQDFDLVLHLQDGAIQEVELPAGEWGSGMRLTTLLDLAKHELLPILQQHETQPQPQLQPPLASRRRQQRGRKAERSGGPREHLYGSSRRLPSLIVSLLQVDVAGEESLSRGDEAALRDLLPCFSNVKIGTFEVPQGSSRAAVLQVVGLLGEPGQVNVKADCRLLNYPELDIRMRSEAPLLTAAAVVAEQLPLQQQQRLAGGTGAKAAAGDPGSQPSQLSHLPPLPPLTAVLTEALARMSAEATAAAADVGDTIVAPTTTTVGHPVATTGPSSSSTAGAATAAEEEEEEEEVMVLLRGSLIAPLTEVIPRYEWIYSLEQRAVAIASGRPGDYVAGFQALPPLGALVLSCKNRQAAEAVMQAAAARRAEAEAEEVKAEEAEASTQQGLRAAAAGTDGGETGAAERERRRSEAAAGAEGARGAVAGPVAGALQVTRLGCRPVDMPLGNALLEPVLKVMQEAWQAAAAGGDCDIRRRLGWLLGLRDGLQQLPRVKVPFIVR